jgi:hypothetical protein
MSTVWDVTDGFDKPIVDTQLTRVRPHTKVGHFSVIAVAVGSMFSAPETRLLTVEDAWVSAPVISVQTVTRTQLGMSKKPVRSERGQYAPDAREGLSTHRLAQTFSSIFTPVEEDSAAVDFSFG